MRTRVASDPYVRAALATLIHRVNNATQVLAGLRALLALGQGDGVLEARASDLEDVGRSYEASGWLLAVFGSALGARTLNTRRERDGLIHVLDLALELARREGRELAVAGHPPRLCVTHGGGYEAPWALGSWLHGAVLAAPEAGAVRAELTIGPEGLVLTDDAPVTHARTELAALLVARVPDLVIDAAERHFALGRVWIETG